MATIGQFMQPKNHSDIVDPKAVTPPPPLSVPAAIPFEPAPVLSTPMAVQNGPNPLPPAPSGPSPLPIMAAPPLSTPAVIPFEPAPTLSTPAVIPFEPAPALSVPAVMPFQDAPILSSVSGIAPAPPSTPGPVFYEDTVDPAAVQQISVLSTTATLPNQPTPNPDLIHPPTAANPIPFSGAMPDVHPGRQVVDYGDQVRHEDIVIASTLPTPGFATKEWNGLVNDIKGMLTNIDIRNQAVVSIPGVGPLPLDLDINTHGGKINLKFDPHLREAGRRAAGAAISYGKSKAQAAINSGVRALLGGSSHTAVTPSGFLGDRGLQPPGASPADSIPSPSTGKVGVPDAPPLSVKIPNLSVSAVNEEVPYNKDARERAQELQQDQGRAGRSLREDFNKYNDRSKSEDVLAPPKTEIAIWYRSQAKNKTQVSGENDRSAENRYYDTNDEGTKKASENTPTPMGLRYLNNPDTNPTSIKKTALSDLWLPSQSGLTHIGEFRPAPLPSIEIKSDPLIPAAESQSARIATTNGSSETNGFFSAKSKASEYSKSVPSDEDSYVPLVFTDLRPLTDATAGGGTFRSVYFRPFIKNLSETFSPQWNMQNYFNRVDKVATYQSTSRTLNLTFKIVSFSPEDLQTNYQKLMWLTSMVYPQYEGVSMRYFAGPVVKLRIGDLIDTVGRDGLRGVPGVITSLNFSYEDAVWELLPNRKLPRNVDVSIGFQVLHEFPIGLIKGSNNPFGGIEITPNENKSTDNTSVVSSRRFRASFGNDYLNNPDTNAPVRNTGT
jgi:hypothetical protein